MIRFLKTLIPILLVVIIFGCNGKSKNVESAEATQKEMVEPSGESANEDEVYHRYLSLHNIGFDIRTTGKGSIRQLNVQPQGLSIDNRIFSMEIDGSIVDAEIDDLNNDGYPEVLIYTQSAGSGSYGNVIGFSVNNGKSMSQIAFPNIADNPRANTGYMGHDKFAIIEKRLVQRFPIYKQGDTNSNPTGKIREIHYQLTDGEASRVFKIKSITEHDR